MIKLKWVTIGLRINNMKKTSFERISDTICWPFIKLKVSPNTVTITGFILLLISAVILSTGHARIAFIPAFLGGILDAIDGKLARETNRQTKFGAFLDSTLDRIAEVGLSFGYLGYFYTNNVLSILIICWILGGIAASLMVSYIRARAEALGLQCKTGIMQRQHRGIIIGIGLIIGHPLSICTSIVLVAIGSTATVIQRIFHMKRLFP